MDRRRFLSGILAAATAPAIIKTPGLLMPIKPVIETSHFGAFASLNARAAECGSVTFPFASINCGDTITLNGVRYIFQEFV